MFKLAGIRLKNFCGYRDTKIRFLDNQNQIQNINVIFGPNGSGKSSLLKAIELASNPYVYKGKDTEKMFRKLTFDRDYNPLIDFIKITDTINPFEIEGAFDTEEGMKSIMVTTNGISYCEFPLQSRGYAYSIDADHPTNLMNFQLVEEQTDIFIDMAKAVYGYECHLDSEMKESYAIKKDQNKSVVIFNDLIMEKEDAKVHYKRFSDGEKKIATLLSSLCNPLLFGKSEIVIIDNIDQHLYYKRHALFIEKVLEHFPEKQFIVTTHSGTLIDHVKQKYGKNHLFDLEKIKEN